MRAPYLSRAVLFSCFYFYDTLARLSRPEHEHFMSAQLQGIDRHRTIYYKTHIAVRARAEFALISRRDGRLSRQEEADSDRRCMGAHLRE